jgi:hypothetical protein
VIPIASRTGVMPWTLDALWARANSPNGDRL